MQTVIAALCGLLVAALLAAERRQSPTLKAVAKTAASLCFVAVALFAGALETDLGQWMLAALLFCALGDVLLLWSSQRLFLMGMAAFAVGHAAYIGAFLAAGAVYQIGVGAAALLMAWFGVSMTRWLWPHLGALRTPIMGYSAIIGAMVVAAAAATIATGELRYAIGAVGFAISDVFVARDRFIKTDFSNQAIGLPLYYAAQLLLASAV